MTHVNDEEGERIRSWLDWKTMVVDEREVGVTGGTVIALSNLS